MIRNFYGTKFDVAIVSGPRLPVWPTVGVRELSAFCSKFGLKAAWLGGTTLFPKGVLSSGSTGGTVFVEDAQGRTHRVQARAVVKWVLPDETPDPFEGSSHPSVLLGTTALKLFRGGDKKNGLFWSDPVAILGTGNRAIRFGRELLERGCSEVALIEASAQWEGKRYAGWEVERRRFETMGGRIVEATPVSFKKPGAGIGEFRLRDARGVRVIEVSRIVSFGPFSSTESLKEYPPGSLLFEAEQSALETKEKDPEGWMLEEDRARLLAARIAKALVPELGAARDEVEAIVRRSRTRTKRIARHFEEPFELSFSGKWTTGSVLRGLKQFSGVPRTEQHARPVASIECIETIGCNLCETACPTSAIRLDRLRPKRTEETPRSVLDEAACTACGLCLQACPNSTPVLVHEPEDRSMGSIAFTWRHPDAVPTPGMFVTLLNRKGDPLGTGRVLAEKTVEMPAPSGPLAPTAAPAQLLFAEKIVEVEVPTHLIWEARGIRKLKAHASAADPEFLDLSGREFFAERVEISWNGERRFVRGGIPISTAFFENGFQRVNDRLLCEDGSCGLCEVEVDGMRQLACRTKVRKGMAIRSVREDAASDDLCPCLGITESEFKERVDQGSLRSVDATIESTGLGSGKCHGQLCVGAAKRCLERAGLEVEEVRRHVDWRFPWSDWNVDPGKLQ
jgi:ferredoxin